MSKTPIEMIQAERERQKKVEGWTEKHDDEHVNGQLADAAACYATTWEEPYILDTKNSPVQRIWPWDGKWDKRKKHHRVKCLVIAGALIVAELERLQRKEAKET